MSTIKAANKPGQTARKSVNVTKRPERVRYTPTAENLKFEAKAKHLVEKTRENEFTTTLKLKNVSLEDIRVIEEALKSSQSSYRVTRYGEAYGGKAKNLSVADAMVKKSRIDRLLEKTRKAISNFEKQLKA